MGLKIACFTAACFFLSGVFLMMSFVWTRMFLVFAVLFALFGIDALRIAIDELQWWKVEAFKIADGGE